MNCPYCRAFNPADEHRCQRCGRRLDETASPYRTAYTRSATAHALDSMVEEPVTAEHTGRHRGPMQPSLFSTRVVSFEEYSPESVEKQHRPTKSGSRSRAKKPIPGQESFHFDTVITPAQPVMKSPEPMIACDARVAHPVHRCLAAAYDLSVVIVAVALFLLVFRLAGGELLLTLHTLPFTVCVASVFYLMYELLWCFADADTAGMRWAHEKLVNFDGRQPTREQRFVRAAFGCLSLLAAGLGILWSFVDEESLTWHDHVSKTFPTPF